MPEQEEIALPFLKWAGGKRWLAKEHNEIFPKNFARYLEPFLGSGSVFFYMAPQSAILSDSNSELIRTYKALRSKPKGVARLCREYHAKHCKSFYYFMRGYDPKTEEEVAARMIYLNRTCWNGLYRVNLKGEFNVPIGTKTNVILPTDNFDLTASRLKNPLILNSDFEPILERADVNDFVFVDPPYTVKHNLNGFVKYNEKLFSWDDQVRLKLAIDRATARGAKVLLTNANHESITSLYKDYRAQTILSRKSVISGKATMRGIYEEIAIQCWL